jgi:hypothetical protein
MSTIFCDTAFFFYVRQGERSLRRLATNAGNWYSHDAGGDMSSATFDTLGYFERLKAAGMPDEQAKAVTNTIREVIDERLATKQDMKDIRAELKELEYRLTIRLGGMMAASIAIVAALVKMT